MSERRLLLELITPDGDALCERNIDEVVVRRQEKRFVIGSEIAIFPLHGSSLIRLAVGPVRFLRGGGPRYLVVAGGFVEVKNDRILIATPRFELIGEGDPDPNSTAWKIAKRWRQEIVECREMIGYLSRNS